MVEDSQESHQKLILALFVTPNTREKAVQDLHRVLAELPADSFDYVELDVTELPDIAEAASIFATPTLVRYWPAPKVTIVGHLSDVELARQLLLDGTGMKPRMVYFGTRESACEKRERAVEERKELLDMREARLKERESHITEREMFMERRERAVQGEVDEAKELG